MVAKRKRKRKRKKGPKRRVAAETRAEKTRMMKRKAASVRKETTPTRAAKAVPVETTKAAHPEQAGTRTERKKSVTKEEQVAPVRPTKDTAQTRQRQALRVSAGRKGPEPEQRTNPTRVP